MPGLVAAYGFDEATGASVVDGSGSGHDTSLAGQTRVAGRYGTALGFNLNRLTVPDDPALNFTSAFSLSAWVKPAHPPTGSHTILAKEAGGGLAYSLHASTELGDPGSYATIAGTEVSTHGGAVLPTDEWSHVAATYDGSSLRLFVNGEQTSATSVSGEVQTSSDPLSIGGNSTWGVYYSGVLDEIRLYNRAISVAELRSDIHTPINLAAPDTTGPIVSITLPANNARVAGPVAIHATATDNISVSAVKFLVDGVVLSEDTWPPFEALWNSTSASVGAHTLSVEARDAAGNTGTASSSVTTVPDALVAAYAFDEGTGPTLHDVTGNGHDAEITNQTWVAGKFGTALSFTDDYITVPDSALLDLTTGITLSAWVRATAYPVIWPTIVLKEKPAGLSYALYGTWLDVEPALCVGALAEDDDCVFGGAAPFETWTHIAGTYDGAEYRIYVNGELAGSAPQPTPAGVSDEPLRIGGNSIWGEYFAGDIDELHIYARSLAPAEIAVDMGTPLDCGGSIDDGNPCTADACNPVTGVTHTPVLTGTSCADANLCNGDEVCNAVGTCIASAAPPVDDSNPCTTDACNPATGVAHVPLATGTSCSDGNVCNGTEICDASSTCTAGTTPAVDDANPCTADACDPTTGITHVPLAAGTSCSDGNSCNGAETCNASAVCVASDPPVLNDNNPCTADTCDPAQGVAHIPRPAGSSCNDFDLCNGAEICSASGTCQPGTPVVIDSTNPCSTGSCDPATGVITYAAAPSGTSCFLDACTTAACNSVGECTATAAPLGDGNPCTVAWCDPLLGPQQKTCAALDRTVGTAPPESMSWIYTGANPLQVGVVPGTILPARAAVLRGSVKTRDGGPLPSVRITVRQHPEFGYTTTRTDGYFDMVVNGGGTVLIDYSKDGYLDVIRSARVVWREEALVEDVTMIPSDSVVTTISLDVPAEPIQVARGSNQTDLRGSRQGTLLVPSGTEATMEFDDGTTEALSSMNVRITEFTVGTDGPAAMPAPLPRETGYTYAFEVNADEAVDSEASTTTFSAPLVYYVENFLGFPVGTPVPSGSFDREAGVWKAEPTGVVVAVVSELSGAAQLDVTGDGLGDSGAALAELGITNEELQKIAQLYEPGQSLWRTLITHFTRPFDHNWPLYFDPDDTDPNWDNPEWEEPEPCPSSQSGASTIDCEPRILRERIPLAGTPFALTYSSARVTGRTAAYKVDLKASNPAPPSLRGIRATLEIAGRKLIQEFTDPQPNIQTSFVWDGLDAFGRAVQGRQAGQVTVEFGYRRCYALSTGWGIAVPEEDQVCFDDQVAYRSKTWPVRVGPFDAKALGLGGWTLDAHHVYAIADQELELGTGQALTSTAISPTLEPSYLNVGQGNGHSGIDIGPDGAAYYARVGRSEVWRYSTSGTQSRLAGGGPAGAQSGYAGDGLPAGSSAVLFNRPTYVRRGPDGSLFIWDSMNYVLRRIRPDGIIERFAGTPGSPGTTGDDGPALTARLRDVQDIAIGQDGSLFIAINASNESRVRRIWPDGRITTIVGSGSFSLPSRVSGCVTRGARADRA